MDKDVLEVGGRAIYEFRAHPRRAPWDHAAAKPASYRARMQELVNALSSAGYAISAAPRPAHRPGAQAGCGRGDAVAMPPALAGSPD
jgi:hypothetical protein